MPIAPLLQRFVDDELARAPALIERTLAGTLTLLRDAKNGAMQQAERDHRIELVEALQLHSDAYRGRFVQALRESVVEALGEQTRPAGTETKSPAHGLELMDESRVEVDIEISRALQVIDTTAEWELRELQTFTSTLIGQTHVSAESNPLRPVFYASALWEAACAVVPQPAQRATLLRVAAGVAAGLLKSAWAAACTRLENQGVEPGIYRTVLLPAGTATGRGPAPPDAARSGAIAELLASMPAGSSSAEVAANPSAVAVGAPLSHPNAAPVELQTIELLARVFDAILGDPQLSPAFVPLLARLQASALRVALRDAAMFESAQHPVWRLLDRIGEMACAYRQPHDSRSSEVLTECQRLTDQLVGQPVPDAALYRDTLARFDGFLTSLSAKAVCDAHAAVEALGLAERRLLLEHRMAERLMEQVATVHTTPVVRRFMTGAWARVLAEAMLSRGEQAESTRGYIKLVDELLWSVQLPDHPQSRQRLVALLPGMLQRLRAGMASIDLPSAEREAVLGELMTIHTEAQRPGGRSRSDALTPQQLVQRMRDEVLPAESGHGGFSDSVIDLGSMETVPAELMQGELAAKTEDNTASAVDALQLGMRLRLFLHGRWNKVQLLWMSEQGFFLLFAAETPGRTHSVTRRALERLAAAGLMQPLVARTLVQRALDRVTREVARRP